MSSSALATVRDLKSSLAKALDAGNDERAADCLARLDEADMTLGILSETLIGTVVSKYKSHATLGPTAKALVKKWKKMAKQEQQGSAPSSSTSAKVAAKKPPPPLNRGESQSSLTKGDEWNDLPPLRKNICTKLCNLLEMRKDDLVKEMNFNENAVDQLCISRATEVEEAMQAKFINDRSKYTEKARSLVFNLKQNKQLGRDVILGITEASDLVKMTSEQLATAEKVQAREAQVKKLSDARRLDWEQANEAKINAMCGIKGDLLKASLFTCGRCKSTKTTSTQKQTRSADEPMTVFVLCMNCGKRWRC